MNFFGMGPMEILVILVVAFLIFGPEKLAELAGTLGKTVREFRAMTGDLTGEFQRTLEEIQAPAAELQQTMREVQDSARAALDLTPGGVASSAPSITGGAPSLAFSQPAVAREPSKADPLADLEVFGQSDVRRIYPHPAPALRSISPNGYTHEPAETTPESIAS